MKEFIEAIKEVGFPIAVAGYLVFFITYRIDKRLFNIEEGIKKLHEKFERRLQNGTHK